MDGGTIVLHGTSQPFPSPPTKNDSDQNINSVKVEQSCISKFCGDVLDLD